MKRYKCWCTFHVNHESESEVWPSVSVSWQRQRRLQGNFGTLPNTNSLLIDHEDESAPRLDLSNTNWALSPSRQGGFMAGLLFLTGCERCQIKIRENTCVGRALKDNSPPYWWKNRGKFHKSPQNIAGASQQNCVAAFSWTAEVDEKKQNSVQLIWSLWKPRDPKSIWKAEFFTVAQWRCQYLGPPGFRRLCSHLSCMDPFPF